MKKETIIAINLPDSRYMWEAGRGTSLEKVIFTLDVLSAGMLVKAIKTGVLPGTITKIGKHVHDLIKWHNCDAEIAIDNEDDGAASKYRITYIRPDQRKENRRRH